MNLRRRIASALALVVGGGAALALVSASAPAEAGTSAGVFSLMVSLLIGSDGRSPGGIIYAARRRGARPIMHRLFTRSIFRSRALSIPQRRATPGSCAV